jgi:hypothetical protein
MKKLLVFGAAVAFAMSLTAVAGAHLGELQYAFQFPDALVPEIDGDIGDWDIVPDPPYWIHMDRPMIDVVHGEEINLEDANVKFALGWNDTANRLYFAAWLYDDVRLPEGEYFSMYFEPLHQGLGPDAMYDFETDEEVKRWRHARAQKYYFLRHEKEQGICYSFTAATWDREPPWLDAAEKYLSGERGSGAPVVLTCEMYFTPWEDLNFNGPEVSKIVDLTEGEMFGAEISYADTDDPEVRYSYWLVFGGTNTYKDASQWGDWLLSPIEEGLPVAVESSTWGRIKSTFVK